jgi:hypothetical protein
MNIQKCLKFLSTYKHKSLKHFRLFLEFPYELLIRIIYTDVYSVIRKYYNLMDI